MAYQSLGEVVAIAGYVISKRKKEKPIPVINSLLKDTVFSKFKIFPNPVPVGTNLTIEVKEKIKDGYYLVNIINQSGQSIYQREVWIDEEARLLEINIPIVKTGNYVVVVTNRKSGKRYSEKLIIQ